MFKYRIKWGKIIESFISVSLFWGVIKVMLILLYELKGYLKVLMPLIDYTKESKYYYVINSIDQLKHGEKILWGCLWLDIVALILLFAWFVIKNMGKKLLIIEHNSLQKMKFSYSKQELQPYVVKSLSINQYSTIENFTIPLRERINLLINEIDNSLPDILHKVERGYQIAYAGIANIPATFYLGYRLGDENKKIYFHKYRKGTYDDDFHLLEDADRQLNFNCIESKNDPCRAGNILLVVALTQPIREEDLKSVYDDNDYILRFEVPETINYDIVDSAKQIENYTNMILQRIAEIQKSSNINEIKICIAASSAFIFALGTKFSKTQNKETTIYHFQESGYPWGINIMKGIPVIRKEA